jgi:putative hemolysin
MSTPDNELVEIKQSVAQLIALLEQENGIIARSQPSERVQGILARIEQLILLLETFNQRLETASETAFRHLMDRPEVVQDDRNTPRPIAEDDDDAARV